MKKGYEVEKDLLADLQAALWSVGLNLILQNILTRMYEFSSLEPIHF